MRPPYGEYYRPVNAIAADPSRVPDPPEWITRLRPSVSSSRADQPLVTDDDIEVCERFGRNAWLWATEMGERVAMKTVTANPVFGAGGLPIPPLRRAVISSAVRVLLSVGTDQQRGMMTAENQNASQEFVHMEIALSMVLATVRQGSTWFLQAFLDEIDRLAKPMDRSRQMRRVVPLVLGAFDDFMSDVQNRYLVEHARWATGVGAARRELVQQIVAGQAVEPVRGSAILEYPLDGDHTALVLASPDRDLSADLHRAATTLVRQLSHGPDLLLPAGQQQIWIWCADPALDLLTDAAQRLPDGVQVGAGCGYRGLGGFRISHLQAVQALRIAANAPKRRVTFYRDAELLVLLTTNAELAARFVADTLGKLAEPTPEKRELRDTIATYLDENNSLIRAAEKLYVNRNTVAYRLAKADRLLGFSVKTRRHELLAALAILKVLGDNADLSITHHTNQ